MTAVLMFHRVRPATPVAFGLPDCYRVRGTSLTPDEFERVLDNAAPFVSLDRLEIALGSGLRPPDGTVLTFDDGYREHLDWVVPRLRQRGATGTFYISTGIHGDAPRVSIVDAWYWLLDHARRPDFRMRFPSGRELQARIDTLKGKEHWVTGEPKRVLLESGPRDQQQMLARLAEAADCTLPRALARQLYLRPDEWTTMQRAGMDVGAHGVTHARLSEIKSVQLQYEVQTSIDRLRCLNDRVPFAYADGSFDQAAIDALQRAKASSAVTCEPGNASSDTALLRVPRLFVTPATVPHVTAAHGHKHRTGAQGALR